MWCAGKVSAESLHLSKTYNIFSRACLLFWNSRGLQPKKKWSRRIGIVNSGWRACRFRSRGRCYEPRREVTLCTTTFSERNGPKMRGWGALHKTSLDLGWFPMSPVRNTITIFNPFKNVQWVQGCLLMVATFYRASISCVATVFILFSKFLSTILCLS